MFRTRSQKIFGDILARKARTALVSVSIFIGVLGVTTLTTVGDLMIRQLNDDFDEDRMAMTTAYLTVDDGVDSATIDRQAVLDAVRSYPNVTAAQATATDRLFWRGVDDEGYIEGLIRAFSEPLDSILLEPVTLLEGAYPLDGRNEVAVEQQMADQYGLEVGDTMHIRMLSQLSGDVDSAGNIPEEAWTISGVVFHPYVFDKNQSVYANFEAMQRMTGVKTFGVIQTRFVDFATADIQRDAFETYLNDTTPFEVGFLNVEDPQNSAFLQEMRDWTTTLTALAVIAMLVSSFLVVTVVSTIVAEQRRQIGVMKSLGATRWDNFFIYTGIAFLYGVIGTIPGVVLGIPAGFFLAKSLGTLAEFFIDDFTISTTGVVVGLTLGIGMPLIAALIPAFMGTRVSVLEAMTDLGISGRYGGGLATRLIKRLPAPISIRQALANVYQKKGRLAITGFTLTLAVGAFMGVTGLFISLGDAINDIFDTFDYQLVVIPSSGSDYDYEAVETLLVENVDGVDTIFPAYSTGVDVVLDNGDTEFLFIYGIDPMSDSVRFNIKDGDAWTSNPTSDGIVLTQQYAERLGKSVGDVITVRINDANVPLEIVGIDGFPFEVGYMRWQSLAEIAGATQPDEYWIRFINDGITGAEVDQTVGEIREMLLQHGIVAEFENQRADAEENASLITTIGLVFNIASIIMASVGAIGLLTMLFISVFERQREIGVMRSVGASSWAVALQFLVEGLLVGVLAWLIGIPLSYLISLGLAQALPIGDFTVDFPVITLILGLVGMMVIATVASLAPSISAARKTVSDILRYQ